MNKTENTKTSQNFSEKLKKASSGYVLILCAVVIPVLLFGAKWVLDQQSLNKANQEKGTETYHKCCAREAALAVAKNWNPGLTLTEQKVSVLKVADAVYNDNPCYNDSVVGGAIPGLDVVKSHQADQTGSKFNPLKVTVKSEATPKKEISYTKKTKYSLRKAYYPSKCSWNPNFALWRGMDVKSSDMSLRENFFDEVTKKDGEYILNQHEMWMNPSIGKSGHTCCVYSTDNLYYPNDSYHSPSCCLEHKRICLAGWSHTAEYSGNYGMYAFYNGVDASNNISTSEEDYTVRVTPTGTDPIKISISSDDAIQVETDSHVINCQSTVAKAVPAQCDVDIVLAIPVNGAANNKDNQDAASSTAGAPEDGVVATTSIPDSIKQTPIYQMGQACKNFAKGFYHTRGVYMSLIPYSGKLSISPDRATTWTTPIPQFSSSSLDTQLMIGACLYGTSGTKDAALTQEYKTTALVTNETLPTTDTPYYWGGQLTGCPIMCRRGTQSSVEQYGNNAVNCGMLLDTTVPTDGDQYKFMRMNLNPCYSGYANLLSMKCEQQCTHYLPNPYYVIEPTADIVKIYEMCNALYPIYDTHNVSNFIFAAFEWANNMFQSWTQDPQIEVADGTDSTAVLSRESKTTSGRKKALILMVNKPDWFEPGEMTYLGFDNDISEIPMIESDCIRGDINYGDTSLKFADGTSYDGTVQGAKKILKLERQSGDTLSRQADSNGNYWYECGSGTYRLKFPHKGTIKLTVAPSSGVSSSSGNTGSVTFYSDNIGDTYDVRKDSTSGTAISLGTAQTVSGTQTFVFSGAKVGTIYSSTGGENFAHNLCVKKVKYSLSKAMITNCVLKTQYVRDYVGRYAGGKTPLILNDGTEAKASTGYYNPKDTYGLEYTSGNIITCSSEQAEKLALFRDSCFVSTSDYYADYITYKNNSYIEYKNTNSTYLQFDVYGISGNCNVYTNAWSKAATVYLLTNSGNYTSVTGTSLSCSNLFDCTSYYTDRISIKIKGAGTYWSTYASSSIDKELQSLVPITSNPITYDPLIKNQGVYLANYNNEHWICFQGDGELHVTVTSGSSISFGGVSGDTASHPINHETTYVITPDQITGGSDGDYYVDLNLANLKLVSAEITNRTCSSIVKPAQYTYADSVSSSTKSDSIDFSSGTSGSNGYISYSTTSGTVSSVTGGKECTGSATGKLSLPYKGTVKLTVEKGSATGGKYVAVVYGSNIAAYSTDGITWTQSTLPASTYWLSVCYGNGKFVAVAYNSNVAAYSTDGITWTQSTLPASKKWYSVCYGNGKYVTVAYNSNIAAYSTDGITWTQSKLPAFTYWYSVCYGNGKYVAVTDSNIAAYSTDGITWTQSTLPTSIYWLSVCYGNGKYVAVANNSKIAAYSTDGITWTQASLPSYSNWWSVCYGNGKYVTVAYNSKIAAYSTDGITWTQATLPAFTYWYSVCYGNGKYVTVACNSKIAAYSTDGITWTQASLPSYSNWYSVCYGGDGSSSTSTIKFSNTSTYTTAQTVTAQTTYTFTADQITGGSDGNYYITFDMTNIKLVSASISYSAPSGTNSVTKTVADVIDFSNGNTTSQNTLSGSSTHVLTTTISGTTSNGLCKVSLNNNATISSAVRGTLKLTLYPIANDGAIRFKKGASDSAGEKHQVVGRTEIEVPDEYLLPDSSDSTNTKCILTLNLNQVYILNATLTNWKPRFKNLSSLPQRTMYIDYSTNPLGFFMTSTNNNFYNYWAYNTNNGYWSNINNIGNESVLNIENGIHGDYSSMAYSDEIYTANRYHKNGEIGATYGPYDSIYTSGLNRFFVDWTDKPKSVYARTPGFMWSYYANSNVGSLYWILATMTLPINAALYFGASGTTQHSYQWQSDDSGNITTYSATDAVKKVTQSACKKLKSDWDSNLRVYLIKFRKQTQYKNDVTLESVDFDYDYLNDCATGTSAPYMYDISTEDDLKTALSAIASDIQTWAGRTEAKIVN